MDRFITLIVMMIWVHGHVQTHQIVYIKHVGFFVYQLYFDKVVKKYSIKHWEKRND